MGASRRVVFCGAILAFSGLAGNGLAQQAPCDGKQTNSSRIASDGTAYITRIVPVPSTVSPEAQKVLSRVESDAPVPYTLEERRSGTDKWQAGVGEA